MIVYTMCHSKKDSIFNSKIFHYDMSKFLSHSEMHTCICIYIYIHSPDSLAMQSMIIKRFFAIEFPIRRCGFSISAKQLKLIFPAHAHLCTPHTVHILVYTLTYVYM